MDMAMLGTDLQARPQRQRVPGQRRQRLFAGLDKMLTRAMSAYQNWCQPTTSANIAAAVKAGHLTSTPVLIAWRSRSVKVQLPWGATAEAIDYQVAVEYPWCCDDRPVPQVCQSGWSPWQHRRYSQIRRVGAKHSEATDDQTVFMVLEPGPLDAIYFERWPTEPSI